MVLDSHTYVARAVPARMPFTHMLRRILVPVLVLVLLLLAPAPACAAEHIVYMGDANATEVGASLSCDVTPCACVSPDTQRGALYLCQSARTM